MAFFDAHFVGNILNRMSFDINCIDEYISAIFTSIANVWVFIHLSVSIFLVPLLIFQGLFQAGGTVVLIATVNWIFLIPMTVFAVTLVLLRNAVMPSLRSLQRLTASCKWAAYLKKNQKLLIYLHINLHFFTFHKFSQSFTIFKGCVNVLFNQKISQFFFIFVKIYYNS